MNYPQALWLCFLVLLLMMKDNIKQKKKIKLLFNFLIDVLWWIKEKIFMNLVGGEGKRDSFCGQTLKIFMDILSKDHG